MEGSEHTFDPPNPLCRNEEDGCRCVRVLLGMKLTEVIQVWDEIHRKDTGDLLYRDLERAIDKIVGVHNDVPGGQPSLPRPRVRLRQERHRKK